MECPGARSGEDTPETASSDTTCEKTGGDAKRTRKKGAASKKRRSAQFFAKIRERKKLAATLKLIRKYQNQTYENYTTTSYQESRVPQGYFPRLQPPEPVRDVIPTENMYRERVNWRSYNNTVHFERESRLCRRRRSHLDDIYLPNYEETDDFTEHANVDYQNRDRNRHRKFDRWSEPSHNRRGANRKQCFNVVSYENRRRSNLQIVRKGNRVNTNGAKDKDKKTVCAEKTDDKNNNCDTNIIDISSDNEDISDIEKAIDDNKTQESSVPVTNTSQCHDLKPDEKTDDPTEANTSITKKSLVNNVNSNETQNISLSPELKSVTESPYPEDDSDISHSLHTAISNVDKEIDSDQETVCYDDFITIDNIDTTKSFLEPIDDIMEDYRVVDMDIDTPSPIKRKLNGELGDSAATKKQKLDNLYAEINSDDLLNQINDVLNEDKQKSDTKTEEMTIKRFRSNSCNIEKESVDIDDTCRSKSADRLDKSRYPVGLDLDLETCTVPLPGSRVQTDACDSVENLLKILREAKTEACGIKNVSGRSFPEQSTEQGQKLVDQASEACEEFVEAKQCEDVDSKDFDNKCDVPQSPGDVKEQEDYRKLSENSMEHKKYNTIGDRVASIVDVFKETKKNDAFTTKDVSNRSGSSPMQSTSKNNGEYDQKRVEKHKTKLDDEKIVKDEPEPLRRKNTPEEKLRPSNKSVETSRPSKETADNKSYHRRRSHEKEQPECDVRKRRSENSTSAVPEKQLKHNSIERNGLKRHTLSEYKSTNDISKKFPPPKIDLDVATDENYRIRRTTHSNTNELLIIKMHKLFGNENDVEEESAAADASSSHGVTKRDDGSKTVIAQSNSTRCSDKRRQSLPAISENDKSKNGKASSNKTEAHSRRSQDIEKVQRRISVPSTTNVSECSKNELRKSVYQNDSVKPSEDATKKRNPSTTDKRIVKRSYSRIIDMKEYKKISRNAKTLKKDPREESESRRLNVEGKSNSQSKQDNDNSKSSHKATKEIVDEKKEKTHGKVTGTLSKTSEKYVSTFERSKKQMIPNIDCHKDRITSTLSKANSVSLISTSKAKNDQNPADLQPKIILQRLDDNACHSEPVASVRPIAERIRFALISEIIFMRCSMLYQERFPIRQKSRNTTVDNECCDQAIVLANPDIQNDITIAKQTVAAPAKESDDVIEIKPEIPVIDLTEDEPDVKEETVNVKEDIKNNVDLGPGGNSSAGKEVITMYRSEETLNSSVDVQALKATFGATPGALAEESNVLVMMKRKLKAVFETPADRSIQVVSTEASTTVSRVNTDRVLNTSPNTRREPSLPSRGAKASTLSTENAPERSQRVAHSLVENAINEAIKQREKQLTETGPPKPQTTSRTVRSSDTVAPPNVVISQSPVQNTIRASSLFVPSEVVGSTTNQLAISTTTAPSSSRASVSTFVKPTVPYISGVNSKKPKNATQYEVIPSPIRNETNDHHTLMVVPHSPRHTEDLADISSISQSARDSEISRTVDNMSSRSPRRSNSAETVPLAVHQSPRKLEGSSPVVQSPKRVGTGGTVAVQSPRRIDNVLQIEVPLTPQELSRMGMILLRYLCFFDALKKAQLAYTEEIKKVTQYLPTLVNKEVKTFSDESSTRFYELSKNMAGEFGQLNLVHKTPNTLQAQYIIESAFGSLKGALPNLTLSWVYLMLEALMQPELVHYMAVPFLKAMYTHVGLVTLRIRRSVVAGQVQVVDASPPPDLLTAKQRKVLTSQINQYRAICARQIQLIAYEQEIQGNIARVQKQFLAQQNAASNSPQRYLGAEAQSSTSSTVAAAAASSSPKNNRALPARRNSENASEALVLKSLLSSAPKPYSVYKNVQVPQHPPQDSNTSNVTIHSNILLNSLSTASSDNAPAKKTKKSRTKSSDLEEQFKIRLPFTLPYDMVPSPSTTTTTSPIADQNVLHSPAGQRIIQNSPARCSTRDSASGSIPTLTPLPASPVYAPMPQMYRGSNNVSPAAIEPPPSVATPTVEADDYESKPPTSGDGNVDEPLVAVKDENDKDMGTIDLTWMDDIDLQQLQSEVEFIAVKKEEPLEQEDEAEVQEEAEEEQDPNVVTPSPADSGIASPSQIEYNEQVFSDRTCICGKTAEYVCGCRMAMYCSEPCQLRDWQSHKEVCLKYNAKNGIKDGGQTPNRSEEKQA